jgi:hypothetical protein
MAAASYLPLSPLVTFKLMSAICVGKKTCQEPP